MKKLLAASALVLATLWLQGCAGGATVAGMTSTKSFDAVRANLPAKVSLAAVEGGKKTNPMWTSQVDSKPFEDALSASLSANGALASGQGAYVLKPTLQKLQQPLFGLDLTVKADVQYVLTNSATGKEVLNETIHSEHTATVGDAFAAVKRLRLANEGAIRDNIDALLQRLGTLQLN